MGTPDPQKVFHSRRGEKRVPPQDYYSVQFSIEGLELDYQFKLRDISPSGLSILVREDSEVLNHLHVGEILEMTYYPEIARRGHERIETRIQHITRSEAGCYAGHWVVGLCRLDKNEPGASAPADPA
jgi:hypothetical protein